MAVCLRMCEPAHLCVCSCVSLLICSLSFVVFCCYQRDSSALPVSHNALLSLSGCTRGREALGSETPPYLPVCYLPPLPPFLSPPCTHLICSLEVPPQHDLFSVLYRCVFGPAGESVRFGERTISWDLCIILCCTPN